MNLNIRKLFSSQGYSDVRSMEFYLYKVNELTSEGFELPEAESIASLALENYISDVSDKAAMPLQGIDIYDRIR